MTRNRLSVPGDYSATSNESCEILVVGEAQVAKAS